MNSKVSKPLISVIIPTCNRANLLTRSLGSLTKQSLPRDQFEVVVIDDGSSDRTEDICKDFDKKLNIIYQRQKNSGIAAAKNMGIFISTGQLLLFFDDDDVADRNLLKEHVKSHTLHPEENVAVLGYTTWHHSLTMTHVMNFITDIGQFLFSYSNLKDGQVLDFTYFWGGRSSCKKSLLARHGIFNQLFRFGSEDIELGYRLFKFGLKVIYNANAKSYMIRPLTYEQFCQRCIKQGKSQYHFGKLYNDPFIKEYCMVERVDEKWKYVSKSLESRIQRVKDLESILEKHKSLSKKQVQEMGNLYWWTFNALKIKGIIEAKELDTGTSPLLKNLSADSHTSSVSLRDSEHLIDIWKRQRPLLDSRGNILIIDPFLPVFDRASGSLRLFEIVKSLIRMGFCITFISRHGEHAEKYVPILQDMGVEVYASDPMALQAIGLYVIGPYLDMEKILQSKKYDYVILSFWQIAEYYLPIVRKYSPESHIIIDTVDIHFQREFREAEMKGDRNLSVAAEQNKKREISIYKKADRLWVVTDEDRISIENIVGPPIDVVPNIHKEIVLEKEFELTSDLIFVGNFSHTPNIDAVLFFHKKIYPKIREKMPDVKTYIVGNNPPDEILRLQSEHFIITGYVEDLSTYLMNMRISISPLTYGAGMKGKIGEALSWGIPVVTTTIGAEGMHLKDNENAMIADNPDDFADKVIELYNNQDKWEKLSRNGKKLVDENWSPNAVQKRIDSSLLDAKIFQKDQISMVMMSSEQSINVKNSLNIINSSIDQPGDTIVINRSCGSKITQQLSEPEQNVNVQRKTFLITEKSETAQTYSWNQALSKCTGNIMVLCRESNRMDTDTIRSIISYSEKHAEIDILTSGTPQLLGVQHNGQSDNSTRIPNPAARIISIDFMLLRSKVLKDIGGLDTAFFSDHLAWIDFLIRSVHRGHNIRSIEDPLIKDNNTLQAQIHEIDIDINDLNLFLNKWDIPKTVQLPITFSDIGFKDRYTYFDLFSSLGKPDKEVSSVIPQTIGPALKKPAGLTSIIILCLNQIEYTRQCLQSIEKYTNVPYELIIVDNGSTDGTQAFLKDYEKKHNKCKIILNERNRGFAVGNNQGISSATGNYILLLNNDVIVTQNWLEKLIIHIESDPNIGMVGPVSNSVSGPQKVEHAPYGNDLNNMQKFAQNHSKKNNGKTQDKLRLVGFCLLIKRQVLDIIGGLDENYGNGNFEDDDLCLRSRIAGFQNLIAHDVFIHHFGSMTFKGNSMDYAASLKDNKKQFTQKWKGIVEFIDDSAYKITMKGEAQLNELIKWGEERFSNGNLRSAIKIFKRTLELDPLNTQALNNLGVMQWQLGDPIAAIKTFQNALIKNSDDTDALENLKQATIETGRFDLIVPELQDVLKNTFSENPGLETLIYAQQNSAQV